MSNIEYMYMYSSDGNYEENISPVEITRKTVASAFWNYEIEEELHEQGWGNYRFYCAGDREKAMQKVDEKRAVTVYDHKHCSAECRRRGMV